MKPPGLGRSRTGMKTAAVMTAWMFLLQVAGAPPARAYVLNTIVGDMRQPASRSGGTSCPQQTRFDTSLAGGINRQWSTSLGTGPVTILTVDQTPVGQPNEIENTILQAFSIWTSVSGTTLASAKLAPLARISTQNSCSSADGLNTICFNQSDPAFTTGVLSFTRVVSADALGEQISPSAPPSSFVGEILDADILLRPADSSVTFATPGALPSQPNAYDLETVLTHELGHVFGFGHSGIWRAMMFPFVPPPGEFLGDRPSAQVPDAPLADDDRTGLRALYPDPTDTLHTGSIRGRILPANPLSLPSTPLGVTGIFGAHVVAVDSATGEVVAAVLAGWSCNDPGPAQFDGTYLLERLPAGTGKGYVLYVEPLDGPVDAGQISDATVPLCRNALTDPGWPPQFACTVPSIMTNFTTRVRPGP